MGNENRLLILCHLLDGEKRVAELEKLTGLSQSALSQHLAKLRGQRLVATRRESQNIHYSLASIKVGQLIQLLHRLFCAPTQWSAATRRRSQPAAEDASP
jgi:DNA-binding transcriptional ArsR family regulator